MNTNEIVGYLTAFDKKGEGDENNSESILLDITHVERDGSIELAFTDRNERCYIQFNLPDLLRAVLTHGTT